MGKNTVFDAMRLLEVTAAQIKTPDVMAKREKASKKLQKAGMPVAVDSGVYGSSHIKASKSDD